LSGKKKTPAAEKRAKAATPLHSVSSPSRSEVIWSHTSAAGSQLKKTPLSQLTQNAAGSLTSSDSGKQALSSVAHASVTPISKQGTSPSRSRVVSASAAKRLESASPGRVPGTPGSQKSTGVASATPAAKSSASASSGRVVSASSAKRRQSASPARTPAAARKAAMLASPAHVVSASAAKRPPLPSPGRAPGLTQKSKEGATGTPTTKPTTSASPARVVSNSAAKRLQSASPGCALATPVTEITDVATRTPAMAKKAVTSASPARVVGGSSLRRPASASPGRVPYTPVTLKNTARTPGGTPTVKPSISASPGRVLSSSRTPRVTKAKTPTTTKPSSANPGRLPVGAIRPQSASPARVMSTAATKPPRADSALRTPTTKPTALSSPSRTQSVSVAKRVHLASPAHVLGTKTGVALTPKIKQSALDVASSLDDKQDSVSAMHVLNTPMTQKSTSRTPTATPSTTSSTGDRVNDSSAKRRQQASPGHVVSRSANKRQKSTSLGRVTSTPGIEEATVGSSLTPTMKPSPGRPVVGSAAKVQKSASPGLIPGTPKTQKKSTASPGRAVKHSAAKRQKSTSPGHVPNTPDTEETTAAASQTPTTKPKTPVSKPTSPSPGSVIDGSAAIRQKSASPERLPVTPKAQKRITDASRTPMAKPSPGRGHSVGGSAAKRGKTTSPRHVSSTPDANESAAGASQTPTTKPSTTLSPDRVVSGSAAKYQKSASPGTPKTPTTKTRTSASPGRHSAAKRQKSVSSGSVLSTPGMDESTVGTSEIAALKLPMLPSPVRVSGLSAMHQKSTSPKRVASTPVSEAHAVDASQTSTSKPTSASPGRVTGRSATKRGKSASPKRVPSTPRSEYSTASASAYQTPPSELSVSPSPGRVASSSSAARHRKSASYGRTAATPKSSASPSAVSRPSTPLAKPRSSHRPSGSGGKRLKSLSPGRAAATLVTDTDDIQPLGSQGHLRKSSATKRLKSASSETGTVSVPVSPSDSDANRNHSASPVRTTGTPGGRKSSLSPKAATPKSAKPRATTPLSASHKQSTNRGVKRSGGPLDEPPSKQVFVSFGPDMSPELFDQRLPPLTPVRRGATPKRIGGITNVLKPALKGRHSIAGTSLAEEVEYAAVSVDSAKASKSAKRRSKSADHSPAILEPGVRAMAASSPKPVMKGRHSSLETSVAEEVIDMEVSADKTPKATKRRSQSAGSASKTVDGQERSAKSGKKRSKSLVTVDDQELIVKGSAKKDVLVKRSQSLTGSKDAMAGRDSLESILVTSKKSPVKTPAAGHEHSTATPPAKVKRTPAKPFLYRSPTLETGSIKVKGSKKIAILSPKRARSLTPAKIVAQVHYVAASSPVRARRTSQVPARYRSPTMGTGIIKASGSKNTAVPPPKRDQTASHKSSIVSHLPSAATVELAPVRLPEGKPKSAVAVRSKHMITPESAKKRRSLSASGQKGRISPVVHQMPFSSSKKAVSPRPNLGRISSSPASEKIQKSGRKTNILDSAEKSAETAAMSARVMTPGRMVAMRAVFGQEMTPKLKMPNENVRSKVSHARIATSAKKDATEAAKPSLSQKSSRRQSTAKVASLKKSSRKSTAKKTLWSEVVRRPGAAQKSGPKIVKPIIVKAQKMKAAAATVVSLLSFAIYALGSTQPGQSSVGRCSE